MLLGQNWEQIVLGRVLVPRYPLVLAAPLNSNLDTWQRHYKDRLDSTRRLTCRRKLLVELADDPEVGVAAVVGHDVTVSDEPDADSVTIDGKTSGHCCQLEILERDLLTADVPVPLVGVVDAKPWFGSSAP